MTADELLDEIDRDMENALEVYAASGLRGDDRYDDNPVGSFRDDDK